VFVGSSISRKFLGTGEYDLTGWPKSGVRDLRSYGDTIQEATYHPETPNPYQTRARRINHREAPSTGRIIRDKGTQKEERYHGHDKRVGPWSLLVARRYGGIRGRHLWIRTRLFDFEKRVYVRMKIDHIDNEAHSRKCQ
jgi:hypothetical protein